MSLRCRDRFLEFVIYWRRNSGGRLCLRASNTSALKQFGKQFNERALELLWVQVVQINLMFLRSGFSVCQVRVHVCPN